jgi:hypothetical protein
MNKKTKSCDRRRGVQLDFNAVVSGSELLGYNAEWPQYRRSKDNNPTQREESDDAFVAAVYGSNARDKM